MDAASQALRLNVSTSASAMMTVALAPVARAQIDRAANVSYMHTGSTIASKIASSLALPSVEPGRMTPP